MLPNGLSLFTDLSETLDGRRTGLVGRNGVGKTLLARLFAGSLAPTRGRHLGTGRVHYLAQQVTPDPSLTLAQLAGVQAPLDALARIEAGSSASADFETLGDRWDLRRQLRDSLDRHGLAHCGPQTPVADLSGGQAMRVALLGAQLAEADVLILDEPSNNLDQAGRRHLLELLHHWHGGLLVVSHDRRLLGSLERILELTPQGLHSHGDGYAGYLDSKSQAQRSAHASLARAKLAQRREEARIREQRERQQRRQARGERQAKDANQAKILLDAQRARSQGSAGKHQLQHAHRRARLREEVQIAAQRIDDAPRIAMHGPETCPSTQRHIAVLDAIHPPFGTPSLSLTIGVNQRIGILGPNGCGKSTLLKTLAGQLAPLAGTQQVRGPIRYLDQRLAPLEQLRAVNRKAGEAQLRQWLAQLGLDARRSLAPSGSLSGGERLKAALACVLLAEPAPAVLLLDEPSNHLDLDAMVALEALLRDYPGALLVASHDRQFLEALALDDALLAESHGWRLVSWDSLPPDTY